MNTITLPKKDKHIDELHFEHKLWSSEAKFYADELMIYQNRLEEIAAKNSNHDVRKQISHFQNQFTIQRNELDILNHEINEHEQWLSKYAKENPIAIDKKLFANHETMSNRAAAFKRIHAELKEEFMRFMATWM